MAKPLTPPALRWNRAEIAKTYTATLLRKAYTNRVTSKCGRVELLCISAEFASFIIKVDGERVLGGITVAGVRVGHGEVRGIRTAKAAAAELLPA